MAFKPHFRVNFGGRIVVAGEPDEIWSNSINVAGSDGAPISINPDTYLAEIADALLTWHKSSPARIASVAHLDYVKCNGIAADGSYSDPSNTHERFYSGDFNVGATNPTMPTILSVALSWGTAKSRGPGSHGRIYPVNALTPISAGSMTVDVAELAVVAGAGAALINILKNESSGTGQVVDVVVASKVNATNTPITRCRVGTIIDVQRRRKNAYPETYVSHDV